RLVAVAAHAQGDPGLAALQPLHAATPELQQHLRVAAVVPRSGAVERPLIVGAHHRLVVAGADHHAPGIGDFGILRVVVVERARQPHRRPQVVGLVAHDQLEHALVETVVGAAKAGLAPATQRGILVVDEDAAVAHLRRVDEAARGDMQAAALRWRHVRPPGPRRDADAARKIGIASCREREYLTMSNLAHEVRVYTYS